MKNVSNICVRDGKFQTALSERHLVSLPVSNWYEVPLEQLYCECQFKTAWNKRLLGLRKVDCLKLLLSTF